MLDDLLSAVGGYMAVDGAASKKRARRLWISAFIAILFFAVAVINEFIQKSNFVDFHFFDWLILIAISIAIGMVAYLAMILGKFEEKNNEKNSTN